MEMEEMLSLLGTLERLKSVKRHAWTADGDQECVAAHSWRLSVMALLLRDEMDGVDMRRVLDMCLVHDFGEAVLGDIPSFEKGEVDERAEDAAVDAMLAGISGKAGALLRGLFDEMRAMETAEARAYRALDRMEAVLQHNEGPIATWLPLEYALQREYGAAEAEGFPALKRLRDLMLADTDRKIAEAEHRRCTEGEHAK